MQHVKKNEIPDLREKEIKAVCIDDFAIKKRHTYGTIMVDIKTHKVVDLIDTREQNAVAEWLKTFPSIRYISRDGSITYRKAITQANKDIIQISDRFHLLKGLTDAARKYICDNFKPNISISAPKSHKKTAFYWKKDTGNIDAPTMEHLSVTKRKLELSKKAKELRALGYSNVKIAKELGMNAITVSKYIKPAFNPESSCYNTNYPSKIKPYASQIIKMLSKGKTFREIEDAIRKKGYNGSASAIRMFATRQRKILKSTGVYAAEKIERKCLVSLLYKPLNEVSGITKTQLKKIIKTNPVTGDVYKIVNSFKEVLFSKKVSKLNAWIKYAGSFKINEIDSFIGGIKRDLQAVKNSIKYSFNNGLAEGSVNKLKVIKRIMFGRCAFTLLKSKLLHLENKR